MNNTAVLDSLTVDGKRSGRLRAGEVKEGGYTAKAEDPENAVITAVARDNAAVTVVPADESGEAKVIVQSENQLVTNEYTIRLNGEAEESETGRSREKKAGTTDSGGRNYI